MALIQQPLMSSKMSITKFWKHI